MAPSPSAVPPLALPLLALLLLVTVDVRTVSAQTVALRDTVYWMPEILVDADHLGDLERLAHRPSFITILPTEESARRVTSTAEYLSRSVSVHVKSAGGYGAYSTASIRGSSARQVQVLVDGVPLNQGATGLVDLGHLPLASLSRIEVYRGFTGYDLSSAGIGGVVNLVTRTPSAASRGHLALSYGSLATRRYQGSFGATGGAWSLLAVATHFATHGNFRFLDDNGTPYNLADDTESERANNRLEEQELFVKLGRPLGGGTLVVADQFLHRTQGLPGHGSYQSLTEALATTYNLLHVSWKGPITDRLPLELGPGVFLVHEIRRFEDRREKRPPAKPDVRNRAIGWGGTLRWQLPLPGLRQSFGGLVELRHEGFGTRETFQTTTESPEQSRRTLVVTVEDEIRLRPDWLRLVPGGRYERLTDRTSPVPRDAFLHLYVRDVADTSITETRVTGSLGAVARPGAGLTFKANYGRYHRSPALMERFGYQGSVLPNPRLRAERGENYDLGLRWDARTPGDDILSVEYAYFVSLVEDLIVWLRRGQAAGAVNFDRADMRGHELTLAAGRWLGLAVDGNLTRLTAINTGPSSYAHGKSLPDRPELAASARLTWRRGSTTLFYELDYIGGNYWNAYNGVAPSTDDPARVRRLHGLGGTVPTGLPRLMLTLEMKNLGDEQVEDVMGFPMPGRTAFGTLDYRF